jgi:hypothetical protein
MKQFILVLLVGASIHSLKAQNTSELKHEIGVSTAFLSDAIFNSDNASPYLITYKYITGSNALRIGLGGNYINNNDDDENSTLSKDIAYDAAFRVGYEKRIPIKERWLASIGADLSYQVDAAERVSSDFFGGTSNDDVTSYFSTTNYGLGLVGGLQFYINDRISLSTETNIMVNFMSDNTVIEFDSQPEPFDQSTSSTRIGIILPTSLYLVIRF